jgi:hypothetical protein
MNIWKTTLMLGLSLSLSCGDKDIEEVEVDGDTDSGTDTDTDNTDTNEPTVAPLDPVAIGFEYSGIWDEAANEGAGSLNDYLFPDLNNTNEGNPLGLAGLVTVTLASMDYFSLGSSATDEDRAMESCTVLADFYYTADNLLLDDYNWTDGGTGTYAIEAWQGFSGNLTFRLDSASERCSQLTEGNDIAFFDNMRFGMAFGPLSDYMTTEFESSDWWADDAEAQASYFTQYIAVNHPNADTSSGYDFIAYDWTSSIFVEADKDSCWDLENNVEVDAGTEGETILCGMVQTEETDDGTNYKLGDHNQEVGSRYGYVQGSSWWYEDYPNLNMDLLHEFPED